MGPFSLLSDIVLEELRVLDEPAGRRVRVELGAVAAEPEGLLWVYRSCGVGPGRFFLAIDGVARYLAEDGRRVTVEVMAGAPAADVRGYLLGSVFGALCHQNGMLPLHASAVARDGAVTAFLGHSGVGKSTTAAFLEKRGYRVVSDDICLLDGLAGGTPHVVPVAGWLKLWRESFEQLEETPDERTQVFSSTDKFRRYLAGGPEEGLRLRNAVLLERAERREDGAELLPVSLAHAVAALMEMTYLSYVPDALGAGAGQFRLISAALRGVQVWRLRVPLGWERLSEALDLVEGRLLGGGASSS